MQFTHIKNVTVSRFILGSNPFSGFSHQSVEMDTQMRHYFSAEKIKAILHEAESLGVNTIIARTDYHVMRLLTEYWDEGGTLQWFAQTCPEVGSHEACINRAANFGAKAVHIHGGVMDHLLAQGKLADEIPAAIDLIHQKGMLAGVAGHVTGVFDWVKEAHLEIDYAMCCHYNPIPRVQKADHVAGLEESYLEEDRQAMTDLIQTLSMPVVHYKIMAAGRNDPRAAFTYTASKMRPTDAVCVGIYNQDKPDLLTQDVRLFEESLLSQ